MPRNLGDVRSSDVKYMCDNQHPFIQLINANAVFAEETAIQFITTPDGWVIHDYGDAISTASPHDKEESSRKKKQEATGDETAKLIAGKGWISSELIAGTSSMQRFFWIESQRCEFELKGYESSEDDKKILERLKRHIENSGLTWKKEVKKKPEDELISIAGAS